VPNILWIDDDPSGFRFVDRHAHRMGWDLERVLTVAEALQRLERESEWPSAIILDSIIRLADDDATVAQLREKLGPTDGNGSGSSQWPRATVEVRSRHAGRLVLTTYPALWERSIVLSFASKQELIQAGYPDGIVHFGKANIAGEMGKFLGALARLVEGGDGQ
jgi:CheY-like chemotaxis protein